MKMTKVKISSASNEVRYVDVPTDEVTTTWYHPPCRTAINMLKVGDWLVANGLLFKYENYSLVND